MDNKILQIAAEVVKLPEEELGKYYEKIPDIDAYYFWNPARGGNAVIIKENGEKLAATSAVSYEKHLEAFISGRRN